MEVDQFEKRKNPPAGKEGKKQMIVSKRLIAGITFTLSIFLGALFFLYHDFFKQAWSLGLIGIFIISFVSSASFFSPAPVFLTVISGGSIYPPIVVALVASCGSAAGDMLSYIFGLSGRHLVSHNLSKKNWFILLEKYFKKYGNWLLLLFAFIPNPVFDAIGLFAGIFAYSPLRFFILVFIGRLLRYLILAQSGHLLWK